MNIKKITCTMVGLLFVLGCINVVIPDELTINIEIRHIIQEEANDALAYIAGETDILPDFEATSADDEPTTWLQRGVDLFAPMNTAYAAQLKSSSSLTKQILESLRKRNAAVSALKKQGCLGETNRGYVELRECEGLKDAAARNDAQKLLADENKDRKALYREVARLNSDQSVSVSTVEGIYATARLKRAKTGGIFQLPPAGKDFDAFKASAVGKKLGGKCVSGAWVTIP